MELDHRRRLYVRLHMVSASKYDSVFDMCVYPLVTHVCILLSTPFVPPLCLSCHFSFLSCTVSKIISAKAARPMAAAAWRILLFGARIGRPRLQQWLQWLRLKHLYDSVTHELWYEPDDTHWHWVET